MPLFMDMHTVEDGVTFAEVAKAPLADLRMQDEYDVRYLRYWVDEQRGTVFCLVETPSARAAATVHREALASRLFAQGFDVMEMREGAVIHVLGTESTARALATVSGATVQGRVAATPSGPVPAAPSGQDGHGHERQATAKVKMGGQQVLAYVQAKNANGDWGPALAVWIPAA
jgi:Nickel responsive protein SCO4226-like